MMDKKDIDPRYLIADPKQEKIARIKTKEDEDKKWEDSYPYSLLG